MKFSEICAMQRNVPLMKPEVKPFYIVVLFYSHNWSFVWSHKNSTVKTFLSQCKQVIKESKLKHSLLKFSIDDPDFLV